jgi:hypothetical protein
MNSLQRPARLPRKLDAELRCRDVYRSVTPTQFRDASIPGGEVTPEARARTGRFFRPGTAPNRTVPSVKAKEIVRCELDYREQEPSGACGLGPLLFLVMDRLHSFLQIANPRYQIIDGFRTKSGGPCLNRTLVSLRRSFC